MTESDDGSRRRVFLARAARAGMVGGLLAGYGGFAYVVGGYVFPEGKGAMKRLFVAVVDDFPPGSSRTFVAPGGDRVAIARRSEGAEAEDFVALSSTCPHLGCQVHWQGEHNRFFCPCHNGAFDPEGAPVSGPPAQAGQSLSRFRLRVEGGLLYIELPA